MSSVAVKTNPALWEKAKAEAKASMGGKHSARAMQKAATNKAKAEGKKKGKQFVAQPKKVAQKTSKFR